MSETKVRFKDLGKIGKKLKAGKDGKKSVPLEYYLPVFEALIFEIESRGKYTFTSV